MSMDYRLLYKQGILGAVSRRLTERLGHCDLCPHACGVNRLEEETGFCKTGRRAQVSSCFLHFGEEPEITGRRGSGAIFFTRCNMRCVFCQNHTLSQQREGLAVSSQALAEMIIALQEQGAENINFVTPAHVIAQIIEAVTIAAGRGLRIPLIYNSSGYDCYGVLRELNGIFDIYMPDIKYSCNETAFAFSGVRGYWDEARAAVIEMHRQAGDLIIQDGAARRGLLVRHLVLPNNAAGSGAVLDFIKEKISPDTYVNIMDQYHPAHNAHAYKVLSRTVTSAEYRAVTGYAKEIGLNRGFTHPAQ